MISADSAPMPNTDASRPPVSRLDDDAIRAAFCHHCENYIALMEYYAPSEHCMEATTRT